MRDMNQYDDPDSAPLKSVCMNLNISERQVDRLPTGSFRLGGDAGGLMRERQ